MRQNGFIDDRDYALAAEAPLNVPKAAAQSIEAPYFVDLVNDTLQAKFQDTDLQSNAFRIYTTLDMRLQREAGDAIRMGMENVDEQIRKQRRFRGQTLPEPQVALVAIDPHTGEVQGPGGRPQLRREPAQSRAGQAPAGLHFQTLRLRRRHGYGAWKAAPSVLTASTMVDDEPTTFWFDNKAYEPVQFRARIQGPRHAARRRWPTRSTSPR